MRSLLAAVGGALRGALVGVLLGLSARLLMRVVALGMGLAPTFDLTVTLVLIGLFALSGLGAGLAGAVGWQGWALACAVVMSSSLLLVFGLVFAVGEVREVLTAGYSALTTTWLLVVAVLILLLALATPFAGWRAGAPRLLRAERLTA